MSVMFLPLRLIPVPVQCVVLGSVLQLFFADNAKLEDTVEALEGKVFRIFIRDSGVIIFLGFKSGRIWVHPSADSKPDVKIESTTAGFARLCFSQEEPDVLVFEKVLKLSGDSEAMLRFQKLLVDLDLDWELELRRMFGDFFGRKVATAAQKLIEAESTLRLSSAQMVDQCLQGAGVPDAERVQHWQAGVESVMRKVGKLERQLDKIEHLAQQQHP